MDRQQQADGEKRVKAVLIDPLMTERALKRPAGVTKAQFDAMIEGLTKRLAYMTETNLAALCAHVAARAEGKAKNVLPSSRTILEWARQIQLPPDDGSPLVRAVFGHRFGQRAIDEGFAPELLASILRREGFPNEFGLGQIAKEAAVYVDRMARFEDHLAGGGSLDHLQRKWYEERRATIERCKTYAALAHAEKQARIALAAERAARVDAEVEA
ncbi:hypothetical protein FHS89_001803 [Rubricella aquisinus]|uniref:Uncharacterized protein n=1 Tax=Rubricella aquisinus TaxID=2028108 RepID=A0A840WNX2_9RHOB|nr:hypothetical protein [Rubricella aquisinus]MBB5515783.1 hypothetical protein [Rubricella aquisinus]